MDAEWSNGGGRDDDDDGGDCGAAGGGKPVVVPAVGLWWDLRGAGAGDEGDATAAAGRPDDGVDQLLAEGAGVDDEEDGVGQLLTGGADEEEDGKDDVVDVFAAPPVAFLGGENLATGFKPRCGPWNSGHFS